MDESEDLAHWLQHSAKGSDGQSCAREEGVARRGGGEGAVNASLRRETHVCSTSRQAASTALPKRPADPHIQRAPCRRAGSCRRGRWARRWARRRREGCRQAWGSTEGPRRSCTPRRCRRTGGRWPGTCAHEQDGGWVRVQRMRGAETAGSGKWSVQPRLLLTVAGGCRSSPQGCRAPTPTCQLRSATCAGERGCQVAVWIARRRQACVGAAAGMRFCSTGSAVRSRRCWRKADSLALNRPSGRPVGAAQRPNHQAVVVGPAHHKGDDRLRGEGGGGGGASVVGKWGAAVAAHLSQALEQARSSCAAPASTQNARWLTTRRRPGSPQRP